MGLDLAVSEAEDAGSIELSASDCGNEIGRYTLFLRNDVMGAGRCMVKGYISIKEEFRGMGYSRSLIEEAARTLAEIAEKEEVIFCHEVCFTNENSMKKLYSIFKENEYEEDCFSQNGKRLFRVYRP